MMKVGDNMSFTLKALRVNKEMTRPAVVARLMSEKGVKISVNTLASYENRTTTPDITIAKALASFYGVSVDDISWSKVQS